MRKTTALLPASLALLPLLAAAQATAPTPPNEQVVIPQVERREVVVPKFPSKDFEIGAFVGTYGTQSFGASTVAGVRLGYHITEDIFVEGVYGRTKVNDDLQRQIFFASAFSTPNPPWPTTTCRSATTCCRAKSSSAGTPPRRRRCT